MNYKETKALHKWINIFVEFILSSELDLNKSITFNDILMALKDMKSKNQIHPRDPNPRQKRISTRDLILEMKQDVNNKFNELKQDVAEIKQDIIGIKQDIVKLRKDNNLK